MKPLLYLSALIIFSVFFSGYSRSDKEQAPPNILLITSEDNGPDLGCYGAKDVKTPNLDLLARRGVKFDNAFVTYSVCSPSRATILTGLYPHQNGQIGLATHHFRMYDGIQTLPAYLKESGYRTGCIGKIHVNPESALPFDFRPPQKSGLRGANFGRKNMDLYASFADSFMTASDDPFFLMVNYPDAHTPWKKQVDGLPTHPLNHASVSATLPFTGTSSTRQRALTADYYNSIERMDHLIGDLLGRLKKSGKEKNTIIIYLGDHGAEFSRGKFSLYEGGLRIPMIIYWPGAGNTGSIPEFVSTIDLVPTILNAAHIPVPPNLPGKPLTPFLKGQEQPGWRQYIFAETGCSFPADYYPGNSVRNKQYKLIHNLLFNRVNPVVNIYTKHTIEGFEGGSSEEEIKSGDKQVQAAYRIWKNPPEYELYDLKADPHEFNNLSDDPAYNTVKKELINALKAWEKETRNPFADKEMLSKLTAEVDAVVKTYPNTRDKNIVWGYVNYFAEYIYKREDQKN